MDAVEDVKARLSIEDIVADYVQLKRSGRNLKGLSPWTNEKTASLMVSPEKQIWHDFSSGKGGNMFSFVMEMEGVDFRRALELLARKAGIDLDQYDQQRGQAPRGQSKERLYEANELAARFYQLQLKKSNPALEYVLKKRAISKPTAVDFRLGFASSSMNALTRTLTAKGFTTAELRKAGLATSTGNDMFRGRIMIPLADQQGRIVGFTGRLVDDKADGPKYLNTPATPIYDKSRHIFGLHLAKERIRKDGFAVAVEGNMDVIASHQAGVQNAVASAGTAMTEQHLKILQRFTTDVRLAFDQDNAGALATERVIPLAEKTGVQLSIITLGTAKDPDDLIQNDAKAWQKAVGQKTDVLDWLIAEHEKRADLSSYAGREQFKRAVFAALKQLSSTGEQQRYAEQVASLLGYNKSAILDELKRIKPAQTERLKKTNVTKVDADQAEVRKLQNHLLALALHVPELRQYVSLLEAPMLPDEPAQKALVQIKEHSSSVDEQADALRVAGYYAKILDLEYEELYRGLEAIELRYEAARLQIRLIERYAKQQKAAIAEKLRNARDEQTHVLLEQAKQLDVLLKKSKEMMPS